MPIEQALSAVVQKLVHWMQGAILLLPNFAAAVTVGILFWIAAKVIRNLVRRFLGRLTDSGDLIKLLGDTVYIALIISGVFVAFGILQLEKTVASLLTGVGILGLTLGFALQDITANLVAGILIELRHPFRVGDVIETSDFCGRVDLITLRTTAMTKFDGEVVMIPNKDIFNKAVINHSATTSRRIEIQVSVQTDRNLPDVVESARRAVAPIAHRDTNRDVELFFTNVNDKTLTLSVRFWVASNAESDVLRAKSDAIQHVVQALSQGTPA